MNEDTRRFIAALAHDPGFIALCDSIQAQVDGLTEDLISEEDSHTALRKLRVWQVTKRLVNVLSKTPEAVSEEIRILENQPFNETLPFFGREEDPFSRRAPIPPPQAK
jgi:hypothetical protein